MWVGVMLMRLFMTSKERGLSQQEKKEEIWLGPMTKPLYKPKCQRGKLTTHKNDTKKSDYTSISDRLRMVSWSNYIHSTRVVNRLQAQPSHSPQQPCNQKDKHLTICK